jgi:hypothetical protein
MRYIFFLVIFLLPFSSAFASDYCLSGAGTPGVDGGYTFNVVHSTYDHDGGTDFRLVYTGFYENRSGANPYVVPATTDVGYYYDSAGAGGSFLGLNTVNTDGTLPIPTVVTGSCSGGGGDVSTSTVPYGDWLFVSAIQIFLLAFLPLTMIFGLFNRRR